MRRRLGVTLGLGLLVFVLVQSLTDRYRLFIDGQQGETCNWHTVFVVDTHDRTPERGAYLAFRSRGMEPFFPNGTKVVKTVAGVPGDGFQVGDSVVIAGTSYGHLDLLDVLGKDASGYARRGEVPVGSYLLVGKRPRSFDSRYWGFVIAEQIIGRAFAIWPWITGEDEVRP